MRNGTITLGIVVFWGVSVIVAFAAGVGLRPERAEYSSALARMQDEPAPAPDAEPHTDFAELVAKYALLQQRVAGLEYELDQMLRDRLALRFSHTIEENVAELSDREALNLWRGGMFRIENAQAQSWLGGIEDSLELGADFIRMGEVGVNFLAEVLTDPTRSDHEHELACEILSFIPHKKSVEALLRWAASQESSDYSELLGQQVLKLPASELVPYLPDITSRILEEIGPYPDSRDTRLVAALAFRHGSRDAIAFIQQRQDIWRAPEQMISEAEAIHTNEARMFLEEMYRTHPDRYYRDVARELLQNW